MSTIKVTTRHLKPGFYTRKRIPDWSPIYCRHGGHSTKHRRLLKEYVSISKFTSFLSGTGRRQSAKLNQVQLSDACQGHRRCLCHSLTKCFHLFRSCPRLGQKLVWDIVAHYSGNMETRLKPGSHMS